MTTSEGLRHESQTKTIVDLIDLHEYGLPNLADRLPRAQGSRLPGLRPRGIGVRLSAFSDRTVVQQGLIVAAL